MRRRKKCADLSSCSISFGQLIKEVQTESDLPRARRRQLIRFLENKEKRAEKRKKENSND
jgi:CO dehydrogenase/acetyl-CoA synthase alpha subunit